MKTADCCAQLAIIVHEDTEQVAGDMFLFVQKIGGDIGRRTHGHHHASDVEGEIHHQNGANKCSVVVETAEVASLVWMIQLEFHRFQKSGRRFGRKCGQNIPFQLLDFLRKYESDIHFFTPLLSISAGWNG